MVLKAIVTALVFGLSFTVSAAEERPFNVSAHGNFKRMLHTGDASGKIALASISRSTGTYGVGALADLRGEIMIWDGSVLVTRGESVSGSTQPPGVEDQAAFLVTAQVKEWEKIQVLNNLTQKAFER